MAKKMLIVLVIAFVCIVSFSAYALDITDNEDFSEVTTDTSFMLDSPLFTRQEDGSTYKQTLTITREFKKVLTKGDYELYVADFDYSKYEGYEDDENLADDFKKDLNRSRAFNIRIKNKKTGYIWATDGQAGRDQTEAFLVSVSSEKFNGTIASNSTEVRVSYESNDKDTVTFKVDMINDGITFEYSVILGDEGFGVHMDNASIKETKDSQLLNITFFPWLGSVKVDSDETTLEKTVSIPGYVVIPSGNGGLIRYEANPTINAIYSASFYGTDLNFHGDNTRVGNVFSMPVYGFVHGVNNEACLVEIKDGSSIATFNYEAAGYNTISPYHKTYLTFNYRQRYNMKTSSSSFMMVSNIVDCDLDVQYSFLSDEEANYVGIARKYQESLKNAGVLSEQTKLASSTQMHVEAFGREYEEGLFAKKYKNMTTINDLVNINDELKIGGVDNIFYTLKGYYKGGYSGSTPTNVNFESALGSLSKLEKEGLDYYLYYNPVETRGERLSLPGYSLVNVFRKEYYLEEEKDTKYTFYTDVKTIEQGLEKVSSKYDLNVAYDGITQFLYGDFNNDYSREQTYNLYSSVLGNNQYPMYLPNAYLLKNTNKYLNMNLYHEKMKFITDSVPFVQVVLRGYVDLYSSYLNFSSNQDLDVLKCIEYGVYPAYLITQEASHNLSKTLSNNLYATEYGRVRDKMIAQFNYIKSKLDMVNGCEIIGRNVLGVGVVEVHYNNGATIVVNYTNQAYEYAGVTINPMKAEVIK